MRPKNLTEDITRLTYNSTQQITYSPTMEEDIERLDEYVDSLSELLTEFRNDRVYVLDMPSACIYHPEGWRGLYVDLDPNLVDTPINHSIAVSTQLMYSFERLKLDIRQELSLNREVFIYTITPFRYMSPNGEIEYRPAMRWSRLPLEIWYNDVPPTDPFRVIKMIKKHEM
jgi:hypothetical protein